MKKRLNIDVMQVGDIILTTAEHFISKGIRKVTKSDISHAMIYVDSHSIIDSTNEGVAAKNTQRLFYEEKCAVHILRMKRDMTASEIEMIIKFARSKVGTRYSTKEALKTIYSQQKKT